MITSKRSWLLVCALCAGLFAPNVRAAASADPLVGKWALTISNGSAGWLEVKPAGSGYAGSLLWGGGSVVPLASVEIADGKLTATRELDGSGKAKKQKSTDTFTAKMEGDVLKGEARLAGGGGRSALEFTG